MKKINYYSKMSYSKKLQYKKNLKLAGIYSLSVFAGLLVVTGVTLSVVHIHNTNGRGGAEVPMYSEITQEIMKDQQVAEYTPAIEIAQMEELAEPVENKNELTYFSYRVKKGDMIGFIADEFGVTQDTIISINNIKSSRLIQIGQYLKIPSMPGIIYTVRTGNETPESIAKKYKVDAEKCAAVNNMELNTSLKAGATLFVPDAALDWVTRQEINGDLFVKPLHSRFYYSSYYGWRTSPFDSSRRTYHGGIDMACKSGTPVYAALAGTVIKAGWSDIYGNYVLIQHHSGYQSLYGHLSAITCKKGNYVYTNTQIGKVGSTGLSTGPHLHFTVYKNGRSVNPATLWK